MKNQDSKRFALFNFNKDGLGVKKEEAKLPYTFINFFKYFKRHFSKLLSVNIASVLGNFPLFFILPVLAGYFHNTSIGPIDIRYPVISGVLAFNSDPTPFIPLLSTVGLFSHVSSWTTLDYVILSLSALTIFTFGPISAATTYIIRNLIKGEPVFIWDDLKYSVKKNFRQSFIWGIFDIVISGVLLYDLIFFFFNMNVDFINSMFFYVSLVSLIIYIFMRYYIYIMMVTFDLSIFKLVKNALIFSFLGFKRNIVALLGILTVLLINYVILGIIPALGIALPLVMSISICAYIAAYAAYPKIKEIMIDPYYKDEESDPENDTEVIMRDII